MKKDVMYVALLGGSPIILKWIGAIIFKNNYWEYTNKIIIGFFILSVIISITMIIRNKPILENTFHDLKGRGLGLVLLFCSFCFIFPFYENYLNNNITTVYAGDNDKINEVKENYKEYEREVSMELQKMKLSNIYDALESEKRENITYYYDIPTSKESIDIINNIISETHMKINELFKLDDNINASIAILSSFERVNVKDIQAEGFVNNLNNVIHFKSYNTYKTYTMPHLSGSWDEYYTLKEEDIMSKYKSLVIHEYTHKLTNDLIDKNEIDRLEIPRWFYEGVAIYSEKICSNEEVKYDITEKVDIKDSSGFNTNDPKNYYETSGKLIDFLINNYGNNIVNEILLEFTNTNDFEISVEKITNKTFDELLNNM